jgi:hypothetical protein
MNKEILVYNDDANERPSLLIDYIEWLKEKLEEIPEQFRDSAYVNIEASESYGNGRLEYYIKYTRPETDNERESRKFKENERVKEQAARDMAELVRLKNKLKL